MSEAGRDRSSLEGRLRDLVAEWRELADEEWRWKENIPGAMKASANEVESLLDERPSERVPSGDPHADDFCVVCKRGPEDCERTMYPVKTIENGYVCGKCITSAEGRLPWGVLYDG